MPVLRPMLWILLPALLGACTGGGGGSVAPVDTSSHDTTHHDTTKAGPCGNPCTWIAGPANPSGTTPLPTGAAFDSLHRKMVHVPTKNIAFWMGIRDSLAPADSLARPYHLVRFTYDLWMDSTQVTVQDFAEAMNWAWKQNLLKIENDPSGTRGVWNADSTVFLCWIVGVGISNSSELLDFDATKDSFSSVSGTRYPKDNTSIQSAMIVANYRSQKRGLEPVYDLSNWTCDYAKNGYRLPTEAEYEFALRGGADSTWAYFWGKTWTQAFASQYSNQSSSLEPVAYNWANPYGAFDLIGNGYEFVNDFYEKYPAGIQTDPIGPSTGLKRLVRSNTAPDVMQSRIGDRPKPIQPNYRYSFRLALPIR